MSFSQAAAAYVAAHRAGWTAKTADSVAAAIQTYANPVIGTLPVGAASELSRHRALLTHRSPTNLGPLGRGARHNHFRSGDGDNATKILEPQGFSRVG
jgi:hypothetical protein